MNEELNYWPLLLIAAWHVMQLGASVAKHGEELPDNAKDWNAVRAIIKLAFFYGMIWWSGLFSVIAS